MLSFKYSLFIFASAFITSTVFAESQPTLKAKTKFAYFNATFTWTIEQFLLFNFGSREGGGYILQSPLLTAIDQKSNYYGENKYNIKGDFNVSPSETTITYKINNGGIFEKKEILKSSLNSKLDNVEIFVNVLFSKNIKTTGFTTTLLPTLPYQDESKSLGNELLRMYENDPDSKFTFEFAGEEINAFKPVMKARSTVFKELLSNETDRLRITDFEPKIIRKMVEYCHNDSIEDFENEETAVFSIAYKYRITNLMSYASKRIAENASIDNAVARFKFAHFYGYESLKKWYFKYIIKHFSQIAKTSAFKTLDNELYKPILEELIKQDKIA